MPRVSRYGGTVKQVNGGSRLIDTVESVEFQASDGIKLMIYGRSGSGKTRTWSTFPKPILVMICSGGNKTGELRSVSPEHRKHIRKLTITDSAQVLKVVEELDQSQAQGAMEFATVVIDHVSGLQDLVLAEILGLTEIPVSKHWGMAKQEQYGQAITQCKRALAKLFNLSGNVVIVGQQREFKASGTDAEVVAPAVGCSVMPKLQEWLNSAVDYIGQTMIRPKMEDVVRTVGGKSIPARVRVPNKVEFCLRTAPDDVYITEFRVPGTQELPDVIVDPDYDKIYALIEGMQ